MDIESEDRSGIAILRLEGRLDASTSPVLDKKLQPFLSLKKKKVLLDFARVDYLSSAGMRLLLSATKKMKASDGELLLCSMSEDVMEIIRMAGFERILNIFSSEEDALR